MAGGNPAATDDDRARSIGAPSFDTQNSRLLRQEAARGRKDADLVGPTPIPSS
jgi:hypothetical protein